MQGTRPRPPTATRRPSDPFPADKYQAAMEELLPSESHENQEGRPVDIETSAETRHPEADNPRSIHFERSHPRRSTRTAADYWDGLIRRQPQARYANQHRLLHELRQARFAMSFTDILPPP